jgi:EmrB/QacA subfamily drug resistance transporter
VTSASSRELDATEDSAPDPARWRALTVCLVGGFMVLLDISIVNVALPSIKEGLSASSSDLQWVLSGYALTFGLLLVPAGRLGDVRGRRSIFVAGVGLFTLASAACGAAQTSTWLVTARLIQGLAGGMVTPQISATIQQLFSGKERGKAFGLFGSVVGLSTAIGPLAGGLLIQAFGQSEGWRWVFFVNLPIGLAVIPIAWRLLPGASNAAQRGHDYDPVGVLLLGVGVVVLLLPFVQDQTWKGELKWLLVPVALIILVTFVLWELRYGQRDKEGVVELALFKLRSYAFGVSMISLYFAAFTPLFFVLTLYLQTGLKYSALLAGLATVPFAIGSGVAASIGGRIVNRFGRPLVAIGISMVGVGILATIVAVHEAPSNGTGWYLAAPLLFAGIGSGLVISPNQTLTVSEVPVERAGTAGGLLQTGQRIGSALGIAAVGSVFFAHLASSKGDYPAAFEVGVLISLAFIVAALTVAVLDITLDKHHHSNQQRRDADDAGTLGHKTAGRSPSRFSQPHHPHSREAS